MKRPILIGTAEIISMIPEDIQQVLDNEGLYIGSNPNDPTMGEAPIVSIGGKVYSMKIDKELDPTRFIEGHRLDGPFRAGMEQAPALEPDSEDRAPMFGSTVRDLMLAVEYMRSACEHAEGKNQGEGNMLSRAMSVGIRVNARHKHLLDDYQKGTFWEDVLRMPSSVGLPNIKDSTKKKRSP